MAMAPPVISEGFASGKITRRSTWAGEAPMDRAASMTPRSTSRAEDSTIRAMKGAAAMVSGDRVAFEPMVVPMMALVTGMTHTSRMMKGTDRRRLMTTPSTRLNTGMGRRPWGSVRISNRPRGRPMA